MRAAPPWPWPAPRLLRPVEERVDLRDTVGAEGRDVAAGHDGVVQPREVRELAGDQGLAAPAASAPPAGVELRSML
jgi:hypothetical protein